MTKGVIVKETKIGNQVIVIITGYVSDGDDALADMAADLHRRMNAREGYGS